MSTLFQQASEHVKSLHKMETWKIEFDSKHGGITALVSFLYAVKQQKLVNSELGLVNLNFVDTSGNLNN
jgi:hypothetical protein